MSHNGTNGVAAGRLGFNPADDDNGKPARKPAGKPARKPADKPAAPPGPDSLLRWARAGVALSIGLSALLNGFANAEHSRPGFAVVGWGLGLCVPALILILARVAGGAYLRGRRGLGLCGAAVCVGLLALSVRHCAHTFAVLTGADTVSAILWAIGVDAGLVVCELATLNRRGK